MTAISTRSSGVPIHHPRVASRGPSPARTTREGAAAFRGAPGAAGGRESGWKGRTAREGRTPRHEVRARAVRGSVRRSPPAWPRRTPCP
ncbi:hypothetical protein FKO01_34035 [Mesorhizobium sp. B2-3-3]|nr:hypothetical protein D7Y56_20290 [Streptomyces sp. S501]TPN19799.1 hypothetical protein FKO01_34035 [Mesorhizobium sp. B2-3-3]